MAKVYSLTVKNRIGATLFAVAIVSLGAVFLTVGFALLMSLAVVGGVIGVGYAVYNRLSGRKQPLSRRFGQNRSDLDPSMEVRPVEPTVIRQLKNGDEQDG
jgi:hypothetical protein